jgi:hypothetical protein
MNKVDVSNSQPRIGDNELILYFYRDGLPADRIVEIDDALFAQPDLRARYTELQRLLRDVDCEPAPEPDAEFTQRVWHRLSARIGAEPIRTHALRRFAAFRTFFAPRATLATACLLVIAVAIGFYAGRQGMAPNENVEARAMSARVLDAYVAEHLRATEGLLLTAINGNDTELRSGDRDLAAMLVESNRLYALAAARAGNARLADFLRQIEPVLIELANRPADSSIQSGEGLRDYLRKTDLLFQVRATQARIDTADRHRT